MDDYLKLGAVVKIKDVDTNCLVIGYYPEDPESGCVYTYLGIDPVYGLSFNENMLFFNQDAVTEIVFDGYSDSESNEFRKTLNDFMRTPHV